MARLHGRARRATARSGGVRPRADEARAEFGGNIEKITEYFIACEDHSDVRAKLGRAVTSRHRPATLRQIH